MKRLFLLLVTLACLSSASVWAANVSLTRGSGLPGDLVTLLLGVDHVPVDADNAFSLDLELLFNSDLVRYVPKSIRKVGIFRDNSVADFTDVQEDVRAGGLFLNLLASYAGDVPTDGNLISLDFLIADDSANGDVPIELKIVDSVGNQLNSAGDSAISVSAVPIPPALLLFGAPIAWMLGRRPRA